jgi:hypothetical protein
LTNPRDIFEGVQFDLEDGLDVIIPKLVEILLALDGERCSRLKEGYSDVLKNIEFSSQENKDFFFEDLVDAIDRSLPAGWTFGPEEEFSVIYCFTPESSDDEVFYN